MDVLLSVSIMMIFLTLLFMLLSPIKVKLRHALYGATATALLFLIGKQVLTIYFQVSTVGSFYGAASALMIVLLWIYYAVQILLYGLEVVKTCHHKHVNS